MSYSSEVLSDSPLWYARLGESSGTTMVDSSGNGHNGTYSNVTLGATGLLSGDSDTAASFNAVSSECNVPNGSWMNTSSVTYEAIIKSSHLSAYHVFMCRDSNTTRGGMFRTTPSGKLEMEIRNNSGTLYTATGTTTLSTGVAYHVAAVFDSGAGTLKLYLNGVQEGSTVTVTGTAFSNTLPIELGVYAGAGLYWWNGVIDEAAYYGTALSSTRIAAHYAAMTAVSQTVNAPAATATAAGAVPVVSAGSSVVAPAASASAAGLSPAVTGTGDATVLAPAASANAAAAAPALGADASVSAPAASASADGVAPTVGATASATVTAPVATASAAAAAPYVFNDSPDATVEAPVASASAAALVPGLGVGLDTDVSNIFDGRERNAFATVELDIPDVDPPAPRATRVDKAVALPEPVLVKGRPT